MDRSRRIRKHLLQLLAPTFQWRLAQVFIVQCQEIPGDERRGRLRGQKLHPRLSRVDPEQQRLEIQSLLGHGWRFVTDYNQLSSLTFRLAFADTFGEAVNSEVRSAVFFSNNFRGFSLNFAGLNDKSFLTLPVAATSTTPAIPATSVTLRHDDCPRP